MKESSCLAILNPNLAKQWNQEKNGSLTPHDVTCKSGKYFWWKCEKGHEWQAPINERSRGIGCPYCSNKKACKDNCLATINPDLAKQWHYKKNESLTPHNVVPGSGKKVWWKCEKGHEWQATVNERSLGKGCPYCSNKKPCKDNCLATLNPDLAKQWHQGKNKSLTPYDVVPGSHKKVWWRCEKGHEWQATISERSSDAGCPYCSNKKACKDNCLATLNPDLAKQWHQEKNEPLTPHDVVPGSGKKVWWRCEKSHEWQAVIYERSLGKGCPYCSNQKVCKDNCLATLNPDLAKQWHQEKNKSLTPYDVVPGSGKKVWWKCEKGHEWQAPIKTINDRPLGKGCPYCSNQKACKDNCLANLNPDLAKQWHQEKNEPLTPYDVVPGSGKKVWWKCEKGHEWQAVIYERSLGRDCPYCSNKKACKDNCLATLKPDLAKQWHQEKNGSLTPYDVVPGAHNKVWWKCEKGHEWQAPIVDRSRKAYMCPYCVNRKVCKDNCLKTVNPLLAKQWHQKKNGTLTPNDVVPGSGKIVWWKCEKGHEWRARISKRSKGSECIKCYQSRVSEKKKKILGKEMEYFKKELKKFHNKNNN